ncbi:MAG: sulfite exporter TauE/SafE family protein [Bacillota bacterium]
MNQQELFYLCFITFTASAFRGLSGVGFSLVFTPLALLFIDAKNTVMLSLFLSAISCLLMLLFVWKNVEVSLIAGLIGFYLFSAPLGTLILLKASSNTLLLLISFIVIVFSIILLSGKKIKIENQKAGRAVTGLISGLLGASSALSGPAVILFLVNQGIEKNNFRASTIAFFLATSIFSLGLAFWGQGQVPWDLLVNGLITVPAMVAGLVLGSALFKYVSSQLLTKVVLFIVIFTALINLLEK